MGVLEQEAKEENKRLKGRVRKTRERVLRDTEEREVMNGERARREDTGPMRE